MGNQGRCDEGHRQTTKWIWDGAIGPVREVHSWGGGLWDPGVRRARRRCTRTRLGHVAGAPRVPSVRPGLCAVRLAWVLGLRGRGAAGPRDPPPSTGVQRPGARTFRPWKPRPTVAWTRRKCRDLAVRRPRAQGPREGVHWYDGGLRPPTPRQPGRPQAAPGRREQRDHLHRGQGDHHLRGVVGHAPPAFSRCCTEYKRPAKTLARVEGHHADWLQACKGGKPASSNFDYRRAGVQVGGPRQRGAARRSSSGGTARREGSPTRRRRTSYLRSTYQAVSSRLTAVRTVSSSPSPRWASRRWCSRPAAPATVPAAPGPFCRPGRLDDPDHHPGRRGRRHLLPLRRLPLLLYVRTAPLSGVSVTTEWCLPPGPAHRSLFFGSDKVNGGRRRRARSSRGGRRSWSPAPTGWRSPTCASGTTRHGPDPNRQARDRHRGALPAAPDPPLPGHPRSAGGGADREDEPLPLCRPRHSRAVGTAGGVLLNAAGALGEKGTYGAASAGLGDALRPARGPSSTARRTAGSRSGSTANYASSPHTIQLARRRGAAPRQGRDARARVPGGHPRRRRGGGGDGDLREVDRGPSRDDGPPRAIAVAGPRTGGPRHAEIGARALARAPRSRANKPGAPGRPSFLAGGSTIHQSGARATSGARLESGGRSSAGCSPPTWAWLSAS